MSGSVSAPAPNKLFTANEIFIVGILCCVISRPILGDSPSGTLTQVAIQPVSAQVPAEAADIPRFLCAGSHERRAGRGPFGGARRGQVSRGGVSVGET